MSNLAILPTPLTRAALAAGHNPRNAATCGLFDIAGRLGQAHRRPAWLVRYIAAMVTGAGFPAPFPLVRGTGISRDVHNDSRWSRPAVDAWFDGQLPPEARAAIGTAERVEVDSRLNTNLAHLYDEAMA